jgi:hypothetical protein
MTVAGNGLWEWRLIRSMIATNKSIAPTGMGEEVSVGPSESQNMDSTMNHKIENPIGTHDTSTYGLCFVLELDIHVAPALERLYRTSHSLCDLQRIGPSDSLVETEDKSNRKTTNRKGGGHTRHSSVDDNPPKMPPSP